MKLLEVFRWYHEARRHRVRRLASLTRGGDICTCGHVWLDWLGR